MTTPSANSPRTLEPNQRRVLGVLIEKAKTMPGSYPMTVNAIVAGCNQKNNRDPLTSLDEADVMNALNDLDNLGVVEVIDWVGRVPKYKHLAYDWLSVGAVELAVLAELLLRGAQALGELRGRAARMAPIADLAELKPIVDRLVQRGLMIELTAPGRGQIVSHNLYPGDELQELRAGITGARATSATTPTQGRAASPTQDPPSGWTAELAELRAELADLARRVRDLEARPNTRSD